MRWKWSRLWLVTAVGLAAGQAVGCAEERQPINRVQANALAKSFFVGEDLHSTHDDPEFWTQGTVVDVGYGAAQDGLFTSTYAQPVSRIKWVITEDLLIGRITYERINDSDGKGAGKETNDGVIAVAYPILSHFDIRRAYNPSTGEEQNVIEENTSDRPWNEREYFRVDWSRNLNTDAYDFDTLSLLGVYGGVEYEPLSYYVNDPNDDDAPHFDPESGYFDVTNKAFATPKLIDLSHFGWGIEKFPACYLDNDFMSGSAPAGSCNPVELTIRQSFRRIPKSDYEPVHWDGYRFQAYGGFYVERYGYARNYGMSDDKWHRFLNRYNIFERYHAYENPAEMEGPVECFTPQTTPVGCDPHRDGDASNPACYKDYPDLNGDGIAGDVPPPNGTDDECEAVGRGSRCDTFKQRCTLPIRDRKVKPIVWYYTKSSNPEYYEGTEWAAHEWDVALRVALQAARNAECKRTADPNDPNAVVQCDVDYPIYKGQQDDNQDAIHLAREVDDCRAGRTHGGKNCEAIADQLGTQLGYDPGVIAIAKMPEHLVLCHSPVQADDNPLCGGPRLPPGLTAADCFQAEKDRDSAKLEQCRAALNVRQGDLRYHQVNVIPHPQTPSPWGIYTDSEDPLTGEKIAASINVWSHVNDLFSQGLIDVARYIKGELKTEDVTEGEFVRDWVNAVEAAQKNGALGTMSREQYARRLAGLLGKSHLDVGELSKDGAKLAIDPNILAKARELREQAKGIKADVKAPSAMQPIYEARRKRAIGTEVEAELMTPAMQQLAGVEGLPINDEIMNVASPLRGMNPSVQRQFRNMKQVALADRGACILHDYDAPTPLAMADLADVLEAKFGAFNPSEDKTAQFARAERMRKYIAQRAHYSVIIHEMGHSMGLRHNFVSSSNALFYRPQYWQLRTKNGTIKQECTELTDGSQCVGPRYFDPVTNEESDNLIWMFMQSSVMDYAGELTQDLLGLGAYDFAAVRMFYGDTVAVYADEQYKVGTPRGKGILAATDTFGGILGMQFQHGSTDIHYSQLQKNFDLIKDCKEVPDPMVFKPASWDESRQGAWHPVLDGLIVPVDGKYWRCEQQPVDYVPWSSLRTPTEVETNGIFYRGGGSVDPYGRLRVPYGFATDRWADLGNLSVYRHDNGADAYELFNFLITQQEVGHIFDNYRRKRQSFSVRSASSRTLTRYNEKMRDGAKGLGLLYNIYRDFALEVGYNFDDLWPAIGPEFFGANLLASGIAFDHFARQMARPEPGEHFNNLNDPILRSVVDVYSSSPGQTKVIIPNGATGYYGNMGIGGKPLENALSETNGEYDAEFTVNAGSYYDKVYATMLMTESVDNFISDSRQDFLDARYRAVSLADLFQDGYRRWLGNNLTGDDFIKGARLAADKQGNPLLDTSAADPNPLAKQFPAHAIGWTSWWTPAGPESCFPSKNSVVCSSYGEDSAPYDPQAPENVAVIDPQVGWEQQKFLIAWTLVYLPENAQQKWIDMMRLWELGKDSDPGFPNRIEFHGPTGKVYVAKTFGKETLFGKTVQKGVAARVLEWANELLAKAYETEDGPDLDNDGKPDWYLPKLGPDGQPIVKWDPTIKGISKNGAELPNGKPGCNATDNSKCTCTANRACMSLSQYIEVPFFLRQAMSAYGLADPHMKGIYDPHMKGIY